MTAVQKTFLKDDSSKKLFKKRHFQHSFFLPGYAFIRFKELDVQNKVLLTRHMIMDRWCDVKVPESQEMKVNKLTIVRRT